MSWRREGAQERNRSSSQFMARRPRPVCALVGAKTVGGVRTVSFGRTHIPTVGCIQLQLLLFDGGAPR